MSSKIESRPLVSLCIPTFNRMEYLRLCLDSVKAQTYAHIEILVSDNCSTDATRQMLAEMEGLVLNLQPTNVGMVGNWNSLLQRAQGEYCVLLSDDDILLPTFVETLVAYLDDSAVEFAYSSVTIIDGAGREVGASPIAPLRETGLEFVDATLAQKRVPYPSAILFRRESARTAGFFSEMGNQTDVAFRISLAELKPDAEVICHPQPLVKYRVHASSLTDNPSKRLEGRVNFQRWVVDRYSCGSRYRQLALFDLLNLQAKGVDLPHDIRRLHTNEGGWFTRRARPFADGTSRSRTLLFLLFPLLTTQHLLRLINNRTFHKRYAS